jgi:hypothetical protein
MANRSGKFLLRGKTVGEATAQERLTFAGNTGLSVSG